MLIVIPPEALYVHNISAGIEDFLRDEGFHVITQMVSQVREAKVPYDVAIGARGQSDIIVFGLQFKRPSWRRGSNTCGWRLEKRQLEVLQREEMGNWIWYALPWDTNIARSRRWLWFCLFLCPFHIPEDCKALVWDMYRLYSHKQQRCLLSDYVRCPVLDDFRCPHPLVSKLICYRCSIICLPLPLVRRLDNELSLRSLRKAIGKKDLCPCVSILGYDSWGTLYQKLLRHEVGIFVSSKENAEEKVRRALGSVAEYEAITEGIIIVIDELRKIAGVVRVGTSELRSEGEYVPPDLYGEE